MRLRRSASQPPAQLRGLTSRLPRVGEGASKRNRERSGTLLLRTALPMVDNVPSSGHMMANVTTQKMTKLDKLCVLTSEWSDQLRPDTNAVSSEKRLAFRTMPST
jgi:hypothetical protein